MAEIELRLFIRARPERVWEILSDIEGQARWMVDVREMKVTSEVKSGVGTEIKVTSELFGQPLVHDVMEISRWEPPHRFDVVHRGQFTGSGYFGLEAVPGGSVFTWYEEFKPPLGSIGETGFNLLVGPHLRRVFAKSMENVRQLAERGAL